MDDYVDMSGFYTDPWGGATDTGNLFDDPNLFSSPDYGSYDFSNLFGGGDSGGLDYNSLFGTTPDYSSMFGATPDYTSMFDTSSNYDPFGMSNIYDFGTGSYDYAPTDFGSSDMGSTNYMGGNQSLGSNLPSLNDYMSSNPSLNTPQSPVEGVAGVEGVSGLVPTKDAVTTVPNNSDYTHAYGQTTSLPSDSGNGLSGGVLLPTTNADSNSGSGIGNVASYQIPGGLTVYTIDGNIIGTGATNATDGQGLLASGAPDKPTSLNNVDLLSSTGSFDNQGVPWAQYASDNGYNLVPNQDSVLANSSLAQAAALAAQQGSKAASSGSGGGGSSAPKATTPAKSALQQGLSNAALIAQLLNALGMKGVKPPAPADSKGTTGMTWNRIGSSPLQSVAKG